MDLLFLDVIKDFKKIQQYFFGNVFSEKADKDHDSFRYYQEITTQQNSDSNLLMEKYPSIMLTQNNILSSFFNRANSLLLETGKCTQIHLLVKNKIENFQMGSYYINYPMAYETGFYPEELDAFFGKDEKLLVLICSDMQYISKLGRSGYVQALKQTGELRQMLRTIMPKQVSVHNNINYNALMHAAGLNVNSLLLLDVIGIKN